MEIRNTDARFSAFTRETDVELLRAAIETGKKAAEGGNMPFGAVLVDDKGNILLRHGNEQNTKKDPTAHAETALSRAAAFKYDKDFLWNCSLYTSFEPCVMCAGAIYWCNIGRVVYAVSEADLLADTGNAEDNPTMNLDCRTVFASGQKPVVVCGPYPELKEEARASQEGFWD